jgi:hypothetical protein
MVTVARMPVLVEARWLHALATHWPLVQRPPLGQSCEVLQPPGGGGGGVVQTPPVQTSPDEHWLVAVQDWHFPETHTSPAGQPAFVLQPPGGVLGPFWQ